MKRGREPTTRYIPSPVAKLDLEPVRISDGHGIPNEWLTRTSDATGSVVDLDNPATVRCDGIALAKLREQKACDASVRWSEKNRVETRTLQLCGCLSLKAG